MKKYPFILILSSLVLSVSLDNLNKNGNNVASKIEPINVDDNLEKIITLNETESQNINKSDIDLIREIRSPQLIGSGIQQGFVPGSTIPNSAGTNNSVSGSGSGGKKDKTSLGRCGLGVGRRRTIGRIVFPKEGGGYTEGAGARPLQPKGYEKDGKTLRCDVAIVGGMADESGRKRNCTWDEYVVFNKKKSEARIEEYWRRLNETGMADEVAPLTKKDLNGRLVAYPGEYRHMAVIGLRRPDRQKVWKCGGTLIDINFVLTAAHCTDFGGIAPTHVKIGDINLKIRECTVSTQRMQVEQIYVHPEYKKNLLYNDIALIRLSKPAVFTRHVTPARLWALTDYPVNIAYALGYGASKFGTPNLDVLTFLNMTMISSKVCKASLSTVTEAQNGIADSQICAIDYLGNADTCQGDSGGPLQIHIPGRVETEYYIIGITSYGAFCGSKTPSVYTRVYPYLDWIQGIVWPRNGTK